MSLEVITLLQFNYERGQIEQTKIKQGLLEYINLYFNDFKLLERETLFVVIGKKNLLWTHYKLIRIRYNRGKAPEDIGCRQEENISRSKQGR